MRTVFLFLFCSVLLARAADAPLVHFDSKALGDPRFDVQITELERTGNISKVRVTHHSGGPTGTALFTTQGMYEIAKARHAAYFMPLKELPEANGDRIYLIGFSDDKDADPRALFGEAGSDAAASHRPFLSVAQFAVIFEGKPIAPRIDDAVKH